MDYGVVRKMVLFDMMLMFLISVILSANINVLFAKLTALFKGFQVVHDHVQYVIREGHCFMMYTCVYDSFFP